MSKWQRRLLSWRSSEQFILITVCTATFTDGFVYSVIVPVLPYALEDQYHIPFGQGLSGKVNDPNRLLIAEPFSTILDLHPSHHLWRYHPRWLANIRRCSRPYKVEEASIVLRLQQPPHCRRPPRNWR